MNKNLALLVLGVSVFSLSFSAFAYTDEQVEAKATEIKGIVNMIFADSKQKEKYAEPFKAIFEGCSKTCKNELSKLASAKIIETYDVDFLGAEKKEEKSEGIELGSKLNFTYISVVDGDTIKVRDSEDNIITVRLIGVDAPESTTTRFGYKECYGEKSTERLKNIMKGTRDIVIETDESQGLYDRYDRLLGYVFVNGVNINKRIIESGYGWEYTYDKSYKYQESFKESEEIAKKRESGLWGMFACNGERKEEKEIVTTTNKTTSTSKDPLAYSDSYNSSTSSNSSSSSLSSSSSSYSSRSYSGICGGYIWIRGPRGGCYHYSGKSKVYGSHSCCN